MRSPTHSPFRLLRFFFFIRKQNNFVLRYPLGFRKPETYLRFYIYTCPIYFIAFTCLGKICDQDIYRFLKQFHFFVPFRPRKCYLSVYCKYTKPIYYSEPGCTWLFIDALQILCAQFNLSQIDKNAINKQGSVESLKKKKWYIIKYLQWHHQTDQKKFSFGKQNGILISRKVSYSQFFIN